MILRWLAILALGQLVAADPDRPADGRQFLTALAAGPGGALWVGSEEHGALCLKAGALSGIVSMGRGLPSPSVSALAVDAAGRVWVGCQRGGLAVLAAGRWTAYRWFEGPLGDRIWDLAAAPDGSMWVASDAGLARWEAATDSWSWWTAADGLPGDGVHRVAVAADGTCHAGTLDHGIFSIMRDGTAWSVRRSVGPAQGMTLAARGRGLPGSAITALLVTRSGTVVAGTDLGVGSSSDGGATWRFVRGGEWSERWKRRSGGAPAGLGTDEPGLLGEDYVSALAEGPDGAIWVGHWRAVPDRLTLSTQAAVPTRDPREPALGFSGNRDYPVRMLGQADGVILAMYGGGLVSMSAAGERRGGLLPGSIPPPVSPVWPVVTAKPPTAAGASARVMTQISRQAGTFAAAPAADACVLPDDWHTRGDWIGRYGRHFAVLAAVRSPKDYVWGCGSPRVSYNPWIGPNQLPFLDGTVSGRRGDILRHWIHFLRGDHPRHLELPPAWARKEGATTLVEVGTLRRQAEWDDHAEAYPLTHEGPNVYCDITIPAGEWLLGMYQVNKDGHGGDNLLRLYRCTLFDRPRVRG